MCDHDAMMKTALELAERGRCWTSPNPMVGALIVKDGEIVGRGWHARFGGDHAEVVALREAGEKARGATMYVTLEPCNHHGKTPPCTEAVLAAGVATLVAGSHDPNPQARGGCTRLEHEGLTVISDVLGDECRNLNAPFFKMLRTGKPFVSVKWAMSADGKIATSSGDSKWITSDEARVQAHRIRAHHDAVLIGIGTVLADNPRLNVRAEESKTPHACWQPKRVILDSQARMPLEGAMWSIPGGGPISVMVATDAPEERVQAIQARGAQVIEVEQNNGRLSVEDVLKALPRIGVLSVLVEGGAQVLGTFLDEQAADAMFAFIAPKIIGGRGAVPAVGGQGVALVDDAQQLTEINTRLFGKDVLIEGKLGSWDWLQPE